MLGERKVAIVGTGNVGTTFAYALMMSGLANQIPLIGRSPEKVRAHVMDLNHGMMFVPPTQIYEGAYIIFKKEFIYVSWPCSRIHK